MPDHWAWVEEDIAEEEPGLYAYQTRPALATGGRTTVIIGTFHTSALNPTDAFSVSNTGVGYDISGTNDYPPQYGGLGSWGFNKKHIVWLYEPLPGNGQVFVAIADTSFRPIPAYPTPLPFFDDLEFFDITAASLTQPAMCRSVPPQSQQISFKARPSGMGAIDHIYFIPAFGTPSIVSSISASNLHAGGTAISHYAFSANGRFLAVQVDARLVIWDRLGSTVALDVVESFDGVLGGYQFSSDGGMLYYVKNGQLVIRLGANAWAIEQTVSDSGTFNSCGYDNPFLWGLARRSPNNLYWANAYALRCGGLDGQYRTFVRFFDNDFNLIINDDFSSEFGGTMVGDFSNDSRWYSGGDSDINGDSWAIAGPSPAFSNTSLGSSSTGPFQMRSFQAF